MERRVAVEVDRVHRMRTISSPSNVDVEWMWVESISRLDRVVAVYTMGAVGNPFVWSNVHNI